MGILLSEVKIKLVQWLWPWRIPLGKVVILDGDPGLGKSLIGLDLIARVTTGRGMPFALEGEDRELVGEPHGAILLSAEDDYADTIVPRLLAAGGDPSRVLALDTVTDVDIATGISYERGLQLPRDLPTLERAIRQMRAAGGD